jgi:hypothetical protein
MAGVQEQDKTTNARGDTTRSARLNKRLKYGSECCRNLLIGAKDRVFGTARLFWVAAVLVYM